MKTQDLNKTPARQIILTTIMQDGKISVSDNRLDNQDLVNDLVAMISDLLPKLEPAPINDSVPSPATLGQPGSQDSSCGRSDAKASCFKCNWTNVGLQNVGEQGKPRWICLGCIVRAVNAHDELVAAGRAAEKLLVAHWSLYGLNYDEQQILNALRSALAKAKGQP